MELNAIPKAEASLPQSPAVVAPGAFAVPSEVQAKIGSLFGAIMGQSSNDQIEWLATGNGAIFKLKDYPGYVIKTAILGRSRVVVKDGVPTNVRLDAKQAVYQRQQNWTKARLIIEEDSLDHLKLPQAELIFVNGQPFIVEEALPLKPLEGSFPQQADPAVQQLIRFIERTGWSDVRQGNLFLINGFDIALPDVEEMDSIEEGLIGSEQREGLIAYVKDLQLERVLVAAKKHTKEDLEAIKTRRLAQINSSDGLEAFYRKKNIQGNEPIVVADIRELGLDLTKKWDYMHKGHPTDEITMEEAVNIVIQDINSILATRTKNVSIKDRRSIDVERQPREIRLRRFLQMGLELDELDHFKDHYTKTWLHQIVQALKDHGYIYDFTLCFKVVDTIQA